MAFAVDRSTIAERSFALLSDHILTGKLMPGEPVTEEAMATELGISRPTMREVLSSLVSEELLTRNPSTRVLHVTKITEREVREGFIARRVIELQAVAAAGSASPEAIAALGAATEKVVAAAESGDVSALTRADIECHVATVALLGSRDLQQFYRRLMMKLKIVMSEGMRVPDDVAEAQEVHREFFTLVTRGELAAAKRQLARRLDESEESLLQYVR